MTINPGTIKIKAGAAYAIGLLLLLFIAVTILSDPDYRVLVRKVSFFQLTAALLMGFFLFLINGYTLSFLVKRSYQTTIKCVDMVILPFMMHLFSYLIPFRGGLLFSAFFLKVKYRIKGTEGIAIGVFTLFVNLVITGLCGVYYTFINQMLISMWTLFSILLILSPLVVWLLTRVANGMSLKAGSVLDKIKTIVYSISHSSQKLLADYRLGLTMLLLALVSIIGYVIFLYYSAVIFQMSIKLENIIMFALMMRLSTLVRLAPGNIGVQEFLSGGAYYMVGGNLNDGFAIALFVRFISLMLTFTIGTTGVLMNMRQFNVQKIKELWSAPEQSNRG